MGVDRSRRASWDADGFIVARNLIPVAGAAEILTACEHAKESWSRCEAHYGRSVADDTIASMRHVNHPAYYPDNPDGYRSVANVVGDHRIVDLVANVLGERPAYFCTTYWFNPRAGGRQGGWHRDSQFQAGSDEEERAALALPGRVAVHLQLALVPSEDVEVVPGSHLRWDTPEEHAIRKAVISRAWESDQMPSAVRVRLGAGDALVLDPRTIHRGRYLVESPRRTLMVSYSRETSPIVHDYFTHQPWLLAADATEGLAEATRAMLGQFISKYRCFLTSNERFTPT